MSLSWIPYESTSNFPIQNLPYGIFAEKRAEHNRRVGVAIGEYVLDLAAVAKYGMFKSEKEPLLFDPVECFQQPALNTFMSKGKLVWQQARSIISTFYNSFLYFFFDF